MIKYTTAALAVLSIVMLAPQNAVIAANASNDGKLIKSEYPALSAGALASAKITELPAGTILRTNNIKITQKDLDSEVAKAPEAIRAQMKSNLFFILENQATKTLLEFEARDWAKKNKITSGSSKDDILKAFLTNLTKSVSVSDDETKSFFEKNKDLVGSATFEEVKEQLNGYLLDQKRRDAVTAHIAKLSERHQIEINKTWAAKQYSAAMNNPIDKARQSGKPTMVDLGADGCQPCEMMTPILESLKTDYAGKANVLFIHVRQEQVLAARYGVQSIPLQIFFDKDGKEVFRHVGFFPKDQITAKLAEMGVK